MSEPRGIVIGVNVPCPMAETVFVGAVSEAPRNALRRWRALPEGGMESDYHRELSGAGLAHAESLQPAWKANAWIADRVAEELEARTLSPWNRLEARFWDERKASTDARVERLKARAEALGLMCREF